MNETAPGTTAAEAWGALLAAARTDPAILAVWLDGSRGKGRFTDRSDHDVTLIVADDHAARFAGPWPEGFDARVMTLAGFEAHAGWGGPTAWDRYNFAHLTPAIDKTGRVAALMAEKARVPSRHLAAFVDARLDQAINQIYRALKAARDGQGEASRLEAAEAAPPLLDALFALNGGRLRPYAKYPAWELAAHPLARCPWPPADLIAMLLRVLETADPATLRRLFRGLESLARSGGHGAVFDAWNAAALALLRYDAP